MTNTKFERDKVYKTRDGLCEWTIIATGLPGLYGSVAAVNKDGNIWRFHEDGRYAGGMRHSQDHDLILPKPEPIVEWGLLTASGLFDVWEDEARVKRYMAHNLIAPGSRLAKRTTEIVEE